MVECRICFEDASLNQVIAPCLCDGTSRYVHPECLNRWRNMNHRAFFHCMECNFTYKLVHDHPLEVFFFDRRLLRYDGTRYICVLISILFSGFFLRVMEKMFNYPSLWLLNLGYEYNYQYEELLENDEIYSSCYFFSLNNFFISIVSYILFFIIINIKIQRAYLYWYSFKIPFLFRFIVSTHFLWGYWLIGSNSMYGFEYFILEDSFLSLFNVLTFIAMLEEHNRIISFMNTIILFLI